MEKGKKMTKVEMLEMIKNICAEREDIVNFCDHEIELLKKKNSSKGSDKMAKLNQEITELLLNELAKIGNPITISNLLNQSEIKDFTYVEGKEEKHLTNQKVSAIFNRLVTEKVLVKTIDKKKSLFSIA